MSWFKEQSFLDWAQTFEVKDIIYEGKSKFQTIKIFSTDLFGRVLVLDDVVQTTERDEFAYHEMLAHVPIVAHGHARTVLIIGGGDGGLLEEVLKHRTVEHVTMVEIDQDVIAASIEHLPSICKKAFEDPRTQLVIADAVGWAAVTAMQANKKFDVILIDRSDAVGPNVDLYSKDFYNDCRQLLSPDGIIVAQCGSLMLNQPFIRAQLKLMAQFWSIAGCYTTVLPTYACGFTTLVWASSWNIRDRSSLELSVNGLHLSELQYYNVGIHQAAFVMPAFAI